MIRAIFFLFVLAVVALLAYNYGAGNGWTLKPPPALSGLNADTERREREGSDIVQKGAKKAGEAATKVEETVSEGALTAKIKSKMVLDDYVNAGSINVTTQGTVVTLTGTVESSAERERAVRLAKETKGVTQVVDKLEIKKR